jgi:hypothetical protein
MAIRYPDMAYEILVQPLSTGMHPPLLSNNENSQELPISSQRETENISFVIAPIKPEQDKPVAIHTPDAPNWAVAPLPPPVDQSRLLNEESRKAPLNKSRRNDPQWNQRGRASIAYARCDSPNNGQVYESIDHNAACATYAAPNIQQSPSPDEVSLQHSNNQGEQGYEHADKDAWDHHLEPSFRGHQNHSYHPVQMQNNFADPPIGYGVHRPTIHNEASSSSIPASSTRPMIEEEAAKLLAWAKANNVDFSDLLHIIRSSRTPQTKNDNEKFYEQQKAFHESLPEQSAPFVEVHARTADIVDNRFWNTPQHMDPEQRWGGSANVNGMMTSPSTVFLPTFTSPTSAFPMSTQGRGNITREALAASEVAAWNERNNNQISAWSKRGGSAHAAFANRPSISLVRGDNHSRNSTGGRREPWSRQQVPHGNTKYNKDSENVVFAVVDKMEGDTSEIFLRHGNHVSSKPASPRAHVKTGLHAEQMRNRRLVSDGSGLSTRGSYGTFGPAGKRIVGQKQCDGWHQDVLTWSDGGRSGSGNVWS